MSAGQTIKLRWQPFVPSDKEGRAVGVHFHYDDDDVRTRVFTLDTPPRHATRILREAILAPGKSEALSLPSSKELQAMALLDVPSAWNPVLQKRDEDSRLKGLGSSDAERDSAPWGLLQLFLDVAPPR